MKKAWKKMKENSVKERRKIKITERKDDRDSTTKTKKRQEDSEWKVKQTDSEANKQFVSTSVCTVHVKLDEMIQVPP